MLLYKSVTFYSVRSRHKLLYIPAVCAVQSTQDAPESLLFVSVTRRMLQSSCADESVSDTTESLLAHDTTNQI